MDLQLPLIQIEDASVAAATSVNASKSKFAAEAFQPAAPATAQAETLRPAESWKEGETKEYGKKIKELPPMTRLESLLSQSLNRALQDGNVEGIRDVLGVLSENPGSVNRVLSEVSAGTDTWRVRTNWEQGTNDQGQPFVRLRMSHLTLRDKDALGGDPSYKITHTHMTIGSDGQDHAYSERGDGADRQIIPAHAAIHVFSYRPGSSALK